MIPNIRERRFPVDQNFEGWRLDRFLANRIPRLSRAKATEIARAGDIEIIPPRTPKPALKLRRGDTVVLREHLAPETLQDKEVSILHLDDALIAINKPAGMLVHESATVRLNTVQAWLHRTGMAEAEPVHRIDRETSGVLVCSTQKRWIAPLRVQFASDHPIKIYRALALDPDERWPVGRRATLDTPLGLDPNSAARVRMTCGPLHARTHVHALARAPHPFGTLVDLQITIETGRQHQIRVHLAMEGSPIAGDKLYTHDDSFFTAICDHPDDPELLALLPFPRHALHAWRLTLQHPDTQEPLEITAPLPSIWDSLQS